MRRWVPALLLCLAVLGCGTDPPAVTPGPSATGSPATSAPTATATATATSTAAPAAAAQLVRFTVTGRRVDPVRARVKVRRGATVRLEVHSDRADEVHLHGYDRSVDVAAGGTAVLTFTATIRGIFEVELEHSKTLITRFQVQ